MKTKALFFGSDNNSRIVLEALRRYPRLQLVNSLADKPAIGILASYGHIITEDTLTAIPKGILNVHPSLLPKYRGPTPVPTAILNGEATTGVTIIKLDREVDHGPIVIQKEIPISANDTSASLLKKLFCLGADLMLKILPDYLSGKIEPRPQNHSLATFTQKLTRDSGFIPAAQLFTDPAITERKIRAYNPWPGVWTEIGHKRLKIIEAHLENGKLFLDLVQLEGKKPVSWKQLSEGHPEINLGPV